MPLHLIKLCVGIDSIEALARSDADELKVHRLARRRPELIHRTRQFPKRAKEILDGGCLYWVIKGFIQVRQPIKALRVHAGDGGISYCDIVFGRELTPVRPTTRRAFQGWRYLQPEDAPPDLGASRTRLDALPAAMRTALIELGLV